MTASTPAEHVDDGLGRRAGTSTGASTGAPMVVVSQLWKVFGGLPQRALAMAGNGASRAEILAATGTTIGVRDVSFSVERGETFVVMGLSGSGKSTLIRCMSRLIEPSSGSVVIDGVELLDMDNEALRRIRRTKMSMVFQHFGLFPHKRVIDNAAYGLEVQGVSKAERHARAAEMLETVGLTAWAHHYPQQLSGGMQQRVGIARALVLDPEILYFDEPFSALDPLIRRDMQNEMVALQTRRPRTVVFITHDFDEALRLGSRIAIMHDGVIDQVGTPEQIVAAPATDYVRKFTTDVPKTKVMTARSVMRADLADAGRQVVATTKVAAMLPMLFADRSPLSVVDSDGTPIGSVGPDDIRHLLQEDGG
ncbi:MAG: glycine betaine/L-proline ABC transporter ATP-binding protein [Ilumatobacteraceae bacterium]